MPLAVTLPLLVAADLLGIGAGWFAGCVAAGFAVRRLVWAARLDAGENNRLSPEQQIALVDAIINPPRRGRP